MTKQSKDKAYLKAYWGYLKKYKAGLSVGLVMIPCISAAHLIQPLLIKHGIDNNILKGDYNGLIITASWLALSITSEFVLRAFQSYIFQAIGQYTITNMRADLYKHVLNFSMSYFDKTPQGTITSRLTSDMESLNESFASGIVTLIADLLTLGGIVIIMFTLSIKLTLTTLLVIPPLYLVVQFCQKKLRIQYNNIRTTIGKLTASIQEQLEGMTIVQLFLREKQNADKFDKLNKQYRTASTASITIDSLLYSLMDSLSSVMIAIVIWVGWGNQLSEALSLGLLVAFIDYIVKFFQPLKDLSNKVSILQHTLAALEKIFGTFDIKASLPEGTIPITNFKGHISVTDVSFAYPGHKDKPVLKNVSFDLAPGEVVAIVGPTGSGKTTISKLISNLYQGYTGTITLDGTPVKDIKKSDLRAQLATVAQDIQVFSNSVRFNIAMGNPQITDKIIEQAAKHVEAWDLIQSLPDGLDTILLNRGATLSAGQAQLIVFARAVASNSPIIFLDEATASIDSLSEQKIQTTITKLFQEKTVLVIAHRLSTIQKANKILAMKDGQIIESGTHEELLAQDGFYAKLFRVQFEEG